MARENQLDGISIPLRMPFDKVLSDLDPSPHFIDGLNNQVTTGGFLKKRGGLSQVPAAGTIGTGKRIDRLFNYETMEASPKIYLVASVYDTSGGTWGVYYTRPSAATAWTQITSLRDINASTRPHEMQESRGLLFIKGFPSSGSSEKLGTVIFDGTDLSVKPWGLLGPTEAAHMSNQFATSDPNYSAWTPSAHPFEVLVGWSYVYAYKSNTGQISNRSPLETNYDLPASSTGAFSNLKPRIVVKVPSNVTIYPTIIIYRSSDAGGSFYQVDEIDVSGKTPDSYYTYEDNTLLSGVVSGTASTTLNGAINDSVLSLVVASGTTFPYFGSFAIKIDSEYLLVTGVSGTTYTVTRGYGGTTPASHSNGATIEYFGLDPIPDSYLDQGNPAPSLTSNSPPPTVLAEEDEVVGVDTPRASTPIAKFAGRLWYGIGNILFYSGYEEIDNGIPEESWPSDLRGNFFRLQEPIVTLIETSEALYVWTTSRTYWLRGSDKQGFQLLPIFKDVGAKFGTGVTAKGDTVYWISNNNRIFRAARNEKEAIGDPLGTHLSARLSPSNGVSNLRVYMTGYQSGPNDWIIVQLVNIADVSLNATYVFDLQQQGLFWQTPWDFPISCITSGKYSETDTNEFILASAWNRSTNTVSLNYYDDDVTADYVPSATQNYAWSLRTGLFQMPSGNNVNAYKRPGFISLLYNFVMTRKKFTSDTNPTLTFYLDSATTSVSGGTAYDVPRRAQSTDFPTYCYRDNLYTMCERAGVKMERSASADKIEVHDMRFIWEYTGGIGY